MRKIKVGTRIQLIQMVNEANPIAPGTKGTVGYIDHIGTLHMLWDNGSTLGLIPDADHFAVIDNKTELTPCKACGSKHLIIQKNINWSVQCSGCGKFTNPLPSIEQAKFEWNKNNIKDDE